MIEILALILLTVKIRDIAKEKGHSTVGYVLLTIALWFGCEFAGAIVGYVFIRILGLPQCVVYPFALVGAACGAGLAYLIAQSLPQREPPPEASTLDGAKVVPTMTILDESQLAACLQAAGALGQAGEIEQAAQVLERDLRDNPFWAARIAGNPRETSFAQTQPVTGYALLVHLAGKAGRKDLALQYFRRMLELNPDDPGAARQAAREAKIVQEARPLAKSMGFSFGRFEY